MMARRMRAAVAAGLLAVLAAAAPAAADTARDREGARAEIASAYKREYAFLVAQKREVERRIEEFRERADAERGELEQRLAALQAELDSLEAAGESLEAELRALERQRDEAAGDASALDATFQQAAVTFSDRGMSFMESEAFGARAEADQLAEVFARAQSLLGELASIRREEGAFFTRDGSKVEGTIVHVGDIATYGVADGVAGALAPAGGGELKIWHASDGADARALARGDAPEVLSLFLTDSRDAEATERADEGLLDKIHSGGVIAWLIVSLGAIAAFLIALRSVLLRRASAGTARVFGRVADKVHEDDIDSALVLCRAMGGSTAAVVATALRSVDRDREQMETLVDEALLRESTHLDRFGSLILVMAAVSPLLGLLGTVTGMIATFDVITEFGTGDPQTLSGGISVALVTTELGLIVAIPTLLLGNVLSGWAERIKDDMQQAALRVINLYEDAVRRRGE